ncbi:hypothetical protein STRIP9103_07186, partial [Streptomyces ipomoeae 91-03]
MNSGVTAHID